MIIILPQAVLHPNLLQSMIYISYIQWQHIPPLVATRKSPAVVQMTIIPPQALAIQILIQVRPVTSRVRMQVHWIQSISNILLYHHRCITSCPSTLRSRRTAAALDLAAALGLRKRKHKI